MLAHLALLEAQTANLRAGIRLSTRHCLNRLYRIVLGGDKVFDLHEFVLLTYMISPWLCVIFTHLWLDIHSSTWSSQITSLIIYVCFVVISQPPFPA